MNYKERLEKIEEAITCGALEVEFSDRRVRYRSLSELFEVKRMLEDKINENNERSYGIESQMVQVVTSKGL